MDTASGESFAKNQTGPLRKIGGVLGNVAGIGGSLATGNVPAIVGSVLDTALGRGHGISGKIGEAVGGAGDRFLGTNQPSLLYKARSADAMLSRAGEDAGGSPLEAAQNMRGSIQDASDAIQSAKTRQTMETLKQQQLDAMQKQAADQQAQQQSSADSAFKPAEKDQAASEKQRQAQIDAYLNQPAEAPASTSSEIAGWQQILANHATKAADAARARAVLERANNGSIDSMAQAKIDKSGKSNEVQLRASELQPGYPGTGDTAGTAAAVQQAMAAQRLRGLAAANPEAGDRLSVGLPAFDPTPAAGLSPPGPRPAPGATQATSQPSPVQPQQETPQGAPAAPQIAPVLSVPGMMAKPTLHAYAERGIGRSVSDAEFQQHMAALTSSGAYPPDIAAQLTTHTGGIDNLKAVAEPLKASLSASSARKAAVGIPSDPLPGEKGEPRSPTQYASGERNYVRLADGMTQDAKDAGHHELATVIRQIAAEPATSEKAKIRAEALHSLPEGERAAARRALTGRLMVGRDDMPSAAEAVKSHLKRNGSK